MRTTDWKGALIGMALWALALASACGGEDGDHPGPLNEQQLQELTGNTLLPNGSFETSLSGWGGWQSGLTRQQYASAPDGRYVARVAATGLSAGSGFSIDDSPDAVPSATVGRIYTASASVAAATNSSVGKVASLVIRERATSGAVVKTFEAPVTLTSAFKAVRVTATVQRSGDRLDVYLFQKSAVAGDAFLVDAVVLSEGSAQDAGTPGTRDAGVSTALDAGIPSSANTPSGAPMPVGDLPGWQLVFSDDFTTPVPVGSFPGAVSSKWSAYGDGWKDTSKNGTYAPSKVVSVHDGVLDKFIRTDNGQHLVATVLPKVPNPLGSGAGQLYGRYVIRFRADPIPGYKAAWLLWPDSEVWPRDGEIDFPEGDLDRTISAFLHRQNGTSGSDQDAFSSPARFTDWHTAVIEWLPNAVRFLLDDKVIGTSTSRVPSSSMHWALQTETALSGGEPSANASGHVLIDWVAVYRPR